MAADAGVGLVEEDVFAALGPVGDGVVFVAVAEVVVGRVAGDESAFEGGQGFADVDKIIGTGDAGEGLREELLVNGVGGDDGEEFVALWVKAEFDGVVVEEWGYGLVFEAGDGGVGPVEDGEPGYIGEGHDTTGVGLAGDADGDGELVGEAVALDVTCGAGAFAVDRHAEVVEEVTAEFDLGGRHGVVGGDYRGWEAWREMEVESCAGFPGEG